MVIRLIVLTIFVLIAGGCGSKDDGPLKVSIAGSDAIYLIPSKATSCVARYSIPPIYDDISASYFQIKNFKIEWYSTDSSFDISVILIRLHAESVTGKVQEFKVAGDELLSLGGSYLGWSGKLAAASGKTDEFGNVIPNSITPTVFTATCPITIGGLTVDEKYSKSDSVAAGEIKIIGKKVFTKDGSEEPVSITSSFSLINKSF